MYVTLQLVQCLQNYLLMILRSILKLLSTQVVLNCKLAFPDCRYGLLSGKWTLHLINVIWYGNRRHTDLVELQYRWPFFTTCWCYSWPRCKYGQFPNFSSHCRIICSKANARANLILRCFQTKYVDMLLKAFKVYVRPLIEYASPIWSPRLTCDIAMHAWASSEALH